MDSTNNKNGPDMSDKTPDDEALTSNELNGESGSSSGSPSASEPSKRSQRSQAYKDGKLQQFKQKAKQQVVKQGKKVIKKLAKKAAEEATDQGIAAGLTAATGGAAAPVAEPVAKAVRIAGEEGIGVGVEGAKIVLDPKRALDAPGKIRKKVEKWGKWIGLACGIFLVIIIAFLIIIGGAHPDFQAEEAANEKDNPLTMTKKAPAQIPNPVNGQPVQIPYTITTTFLGRAKDILVSDTIPANTEFVSASGKYKQVKVEDRVTYIVWSARENGAATGAEPSTFSPFVVTITLKTLATTTWIINPANASVMGGLGLDGVITAGSTDFVPPSTTNDCGGLYAADITRNFLLHANYGDPVCNFSKENLAALIKEKDPKFLYEWFDVIAKYESGYNPNAWAAPVGEQQTIDSCGAWGLFQMGSSYRSERERDVCVPGLPPPSPGKNGEFDRGDVNWQVQTSNAIMDNRQRLHCNFMYYSTACHESYTGAACFWNKYSC